MEIMTDSLVPGEPKEPRTRALFAIYRAFATPEETARCAARYAAGIGWGETKQLLFERIDAELAPARAEYERLDRVARGKSSAICSRAPRKRAR